MILKRFYPEEYVNVRIDVEEKASRMRINSTTFDTWDGRFWEDLTAEERDEWMWKAREDLEVNYVRVV